MMAWNNIQREDHIMLLTQDPVHVGECHVMMMKSTVLQESPELKTRHYERVVCAVLITKLTVIRVDLTELGHVTHDDKDNLTVTRRQTELSNI